MLSYEYLVIKIEVTIILELFYFETVQSVVPLRCVDRVLGA